MRTIRPFQPRCGCLPAFLIMPASLENQAPSKGRGAWPLFQFLEPGHPGRPTSNPNPQWCVTCLSLKLSHNCDLEAQYKSELRYARLGRSGDFRFPRNPAREGPSQRH